MEPSQYLPIIDLLREVTVLVTADGVIQVANQPARTLLNLAMLPTGQHLGTFLADSKTLPEYLRRCARSRDPSIATMQLRVGDEECKYRCYGAMATPRTSESPALVMLTLLPQDTVGEPFLLLNDKLDELSREIERRKESEHIIRQHLELSEFGRDFGLALAQAGSLDEMLKSCTDLLVQHLGAAFARIWLVDSSGKTLVLRASSGMYTHLDGGHSRIPVGKLKIGLIAKTQKPHLTNKVVGDKRVNDQVWANEQQMVAFAGYPLIVDGVTSGVMAMFSRDRLSTAVMDAMGSVASELAVGIGRKRAEQSLREKAAALELADTRKNEFLAMLAHELRNPLAPIRSGLELLHGEIPENDVLPLMQDHLSHMVRIVDDLLDVSRIMRGKIELRKRDVCVKELVKRSLDAVEPQIKSAGHELQVRGTDQDLYVHGDEVRLTQVLTNLLHNAAKYTPAKGRIVLEVTSSEEDVCFCVRDNGIGVAPEFMPELFNLFAQASHALDRSQGGLGIGLTLVKQIVSMHGGSVSADSEGLGKGTTFTVRLPRTTPPVAANAVESPDKRAAPEERDVPAYKVMLVDDNVASAKILARLLQRNWPHELTIEHDGEAAINRAADDSPDIIFLDIGLPGLSGYEVAKRLRADPQFDRTFIVALTGYGTEEDRKKSAASGFNVHLVKPIGLEDLTLVFRMCTQHAGSN